MIPELSIGYIFSRNPLGFYHFFIHNALNFSILHKTVYKSMFHENKD